LYGYGIGPGTFKGGIIRFVGVTVEKTQMRRAPSTATSWPTTDMHRLAVGLTN
jgi:hypothetical protein